MEAELYELSISAMISSGSSGFLKLLTEGAVATTWFGKRLPQLTILCEKK